MPVLSTSGSQLPLGHGLRSDYRVAGEGNLGYPLPHLVTGMIPANPTMVPTNSTPKFVSHDGDGSAIHRSSHGPKLYFPKFNAENPRLWHDQCVLYFEVYGTHPSMMTRFATLNFQGSVATWLQTVERSGWITDWQKLYDLVFLVFTKYDKDQYHTQLCQLESLKQIGSMAEYQH
jgi:hypothetical protein